MSVAYVKVAKPGQTAGVFRVFFFFVIWFCGASFACILAAVKGSFGLFFFCLDY